MKPKPQEVSGSGLAEVLRVLNGLIEKKLLVTYAIAGGVAAWYYLEPVLTYDFDIICRFSGDVSLIDPSPVFTELKALGYDFGMEDRVMIGGIPVRFIPAAPGLMEEALEKATPVTLSGVATRILTLEYLSALMLQLYRPKDRAKLDLLFGEEETALNPNCSRISSDVMDWLNSGNASMKLEPLADRKRRARRQLARLPFEKRSRRWCGCRSLPGKWQRPAASHSGGASGLAV